MRVILFFILLGLTVACSLFEYHPYEIRLNEEEKNLNAKAINQILSKPVSDTLQFILIGDTQRFYEETQQFVASVNEQKADFVIIAGDISDFGLEIEFKWVNDIMKKLNKPYIAVIGNHDLTGQGEAVFKQMFGPLNDAFVYGDTKFVLINTNSREYRFNGIVPDLKWLENQLKDENYSEAVVIGHVPPFNNDFDQTLEAAYADMLGKSGKVRLSIYAHEHSYRDTVPYHDNINYVVSASVKDKFYLLVKMNKEFYSVQQVYY